MKKLLLLKFFFMFYVLSYAQTNSYSTQYFSDAGYPGGIRPSSSSATSTSGWNQLLDGGLSVNTWSDPVAIPFSFEFFGNPVTHLKASSNFLVTFDTAATQIPSVNTNLPSATLPDSTIAVFWDEFTSAPPISTSDRVYTREYGTAPNRQFWVFWYSYEIGNPNLSFAYVGLALEESTNKIYMVDLYSSSSPALTATVGVQLNSSTFVQEGDSLTPISGNGSGTSDIDYYEFAPKILTPTDAKLAAIVSPMDGVCYGAAENVTVTIENTGTGSISNIPVVVNISGAITQTLNGTYTGTLPPGGSVNLTVGQVNMSANGAYNFVASTQLTGDGDPNNDTLAVVTLSNNSISSLPHIEDFESASTGSPGTLPAGWEFDAPTSFEWQVDNSNTGSGSTGPDNDHTLGTSAGKYVYTEASSGSNGDSTFLTSPCVDLGTLTAPSMTFWYHMYGSAIGELHVDIYNGTSWDRSVFSIIGQQQFDETDPWQMANVDLTAYAGNTIKVRFRGIRGSALQGDIALDDIKFFQKPNQDVAIISFLNPLDEGCYTANEQVSVQIVNTGSQAISNVPVSLNIVAPTPIPSLSATYPNTISPGDTATLILGTVNMSNGGVYDFEAIGGLLNDGDATNDTMRISRTVIAPLTPSLTEVDFEAFTGSNLSTVHPGWSEADGLTPDGTTSSWTSSSATQETHFGTSTAKLYFSNFSGVNTEWIVGPKFTVGTNTHLFFDAAVTTSSNTAQAFMGQEDSVFIMLSTDCGVSFKKFGTINSSNNLTNQLTGFDFDLSALAGNNVILAFYAVAGSSTPASAYDFHLDNILIKELVPIDAGVVDVLSPLMQGCYGSTENVVASVYNYGTTALSNFPVNANITLPGGTVVPLTATMTSSIPVGGTGNVTLGQVNMTTAGTYEFDIFTNLTNEGDRMNDTLSFTIDVAPTVTLPVGPVTFDGFTGSNLTTVFPNWYEASGTDAPMGTTSIWRNSTALGQPTARLNLFTDTREEWIVGPKFIVGNSTHLKYKAAVTDYNNASPAFMGSDDSVRVMISGDCGVSWIKLTEMTARDTLPNTLQQFDIDLSAIISAGTPVIIAFYATDGPSNDPEDYDFHLDDIEVLEVVPNDVAVVDLRTAMTGCGLSSTEDVCVTIQNFGTASQSNIPVNFNLNNGTVVTETFAGPLAPGDTVSYCFTAKADLSTPGMYTVRAFTTLSTDQLIANDSAKVEVESFLSPNPPTVADITRCGPGPIVLNASNTTGNAIRWYDSPSATMSIDTGLVFRDTINTTTTYYVAEVSGGGLETIGKVALGSDGSYLDTDPGRGLIFDATAAFTLQYVHVYPTGTGTIQIQILDLSNNVILQGPVVNITGSGSTKVQVPVNLQIPVGTYKIGMLSTGITGLRRDFSATFPYTSPSGVVTITNGVYSTTPIATYYWFYEWGVSTGCESQRVPVVANVSSSIPALASASQDTICEGASTTLSVSSANSGYTFTWDGGSLSGTAGASQIVSPTVTTQYIVTAVDGNCNATDTLTVVVNPASMAGTVSPSGAVCLGNSTTLKVSGYTGDIQWQKLVAGSWVDETATGAMTDAYSITPTVDADYRAVVTSGICSSVISDTVSITISNPQITAVNGATRCDTGVVNLSATGTGSDINWYASATGGSPIHIGSTYSPSVMATDTFYVSATSGGNGIDSLAALPLAGGNGCSGGNMFDLTPATNLEITGFTINNGDAAGTSSPVEIYYKTGSHLGSETNSAAWTLHQTVTVTSNGPNNATRVMINPLPVNAGQSYGIYINFEADYTNITGPTTLSNSDMSITMGTGLCSLFGGTNANRGFNGNVIYSAGCVSSRTQVIATVNPAPAHTISSTGSNLIYNFSTTATGVTSYSWNFGDGSAVATTASPSHTYAAAGNYQVSLTVTYANGCTAMDTMQLSAVTGMKEDLAAQVNLYPNPTSGKLYLELEKAEEAKITVHNMQGQVVRRASTHGAAKVVLDLDGLATGSYLIKVDNGAQMFTKKVLYQNLK